MCRRTAGEWVGNLGSRQQGTERDSGGRGSGRGGSRDGSGRGGSRDGGGTAPSAG